MEENIQRAEQQLLKTYNRYPVVFDRGNGVTLYDTEGNAYLDFFSGIGVQGLGHHYPGLQEAVKEQVDKLWHTSNYFYNEPAIEASEKLLKVAQMERVFFTNSGTEAIEGALKIARKYGVEKHGKDCYEIIAMNHSFHGRTIGALSVTGNAHYRESFEPLLPGVKFAMYNDLQSVRALVSEKTCGIIVEPLQGEGGIHPATEEFLQGLRDLADQYDLILIFDEIQCGMGRTGKYFAWQNFGIQPDVMTVAKALGNGVPIGAFLAAGKAVNILEPGDHGSTYGGNPLVCAAAAKVLDIFEKDQIPENAKVVGEYLKEKLNTLSKHHGHIIECRGCGLMLGLEFDVPVGEIIQKVLLEEKMVLINAGSHVIRFIPPLVITKENVDDAVARLDRVLTKLDF